MADDKTKIGGADRRTVSGGEEYEVRYFAERHGVSTEQAQELINRHGNDREVLDREAAKLKA